MRNTTEAKWNIAPATNHSLEEKTLLQAPIKGIDGIQAVHTRFSTNHTDLDSELPRAIFATRMNYYFHYLLPWNIVGDVDRRDLAPEWQIGLLVKRSLWLSAGADDGQQTCRGGRTGFQIRLDILQALMLSA